MRHFGDAGLTWLRAALADAPPAAAHVLAYDPESRTITLSAEAAEEVVRGGQLLCGALHKAAFAAPPFGLGHAHHQVVRAPARGAARAPARASPRDHQPHYSFPPAARPGSGRLARPSGAEPPGRRSDP